MEYRACSNSTKVWSKMNIPHNSVQVETGLKLTPLLTAWANLSSSSKIFCWPCVSKIINLISNPQTGITRPNSHHWYVVNHAINETKPRNDNPLSPSMAGRGISWLCWATILHGWLGAAVWVEWGASYSKEWGSSYLVHPWYAPRVNTMRHICPPNIRRPSRHPDDPSDIPTAPWMYQLPQMYY